MTIKKRKLRVYSTEMDWRLICFVQVVHRTITLRKSYHHKRVVLKRSMHVWSVWNEITVLWYSTRSELNIDVKSVHNERWQLGLSIEDDLLEIVNNTQGQWLMKHIDGIVVFLNELIDISIEISHLWRNFLENRKETNAKMEKEVHLLCQVITSMSRTIRFVRPVIGFDRLVQFYFEFDVLVN